jgi:hypothetical protein
MVGQFLASSVLDHETTGPILYRPRWPKTSRLIHGTSAAAHECEQIGRRHFVIKARMLPLTMVATKSRKHRFAFHVGFNPTVPS